MYVYELTAVNSYYSFFTTFLTWAHIAITQFLSYCSVVSVKKKGGFFYEEKAPPLSLLAKVSTYLKTVLLIQEQLTADQHTADLRRACTDLI